MKEKIGWIVLGVAAFFVFFMLSDGFYAITPPNGPVDTAYKINRFTGKVWMIKTYTKQMGPIRVLAAREADVEKTKELTEADIPSVAAAEAAPTARGSRMR
jgi:hypothetical protein